MVVGWGENCNHVMRETVECCVVSFLDYKITSTFWVFQLFVVCLLVYTDISQGVENLLLGLPPSTNPNVAGSHVTARDLIVYSHGARSRCARISSLPGSATRDQFVKTALFKIHPKCVHKRTNFLSKPVRTSWSTGGRSRRHHPQHPAVRHRLSRERTLIPPANSNHF